MHREYRDCEIVFDLLPLYVDGKTSDESNAFVRRHLAECKGCQQTCQFMQEDFGGLQMKESTYLKRKKHRKISKAKMLVIVVLSLYVLGLAVFICWFFYAAALPVL